MLRVDDQGTREFWLAADGEQYHLHLLNAPMSLGDPNQLHRAALECAGGVCGVEPYDASVARRMTDESLYSGRPMQGRSGARVLLVFHHIDADAHFVGPISDTISSDVQRTASGPLGVLRRVVT